MWAGGSSSGTGRGYVAAGIAATEKTATATVLGPRNYTPTRRRRRRRRVRGRQEALQDVSLPASECTSIQALR